MPFTTPGCRVVPATLSMVGSTDVTTFASEPVSENPPLGNVVYGVVLMSFVIASKIVFAAAWSFAVSVVEVLVVGISDSMKLFGSSNQRPPSDELQGAELRTRQGERGDARQHVDIDQDIDIAVDFADIAQRLRADVDRDLGVGRDARL